MTRASHPHVTTTTRETLSPACSVPPTLTHEHTGHVTSCPLAWASIRKLAAASGTGRQADTQRSQELGLQKEANWMRLPTRCDPEQGTRPLGPSAVPTLTGPQGEPTGPAETAPGPAPGSCARRLWHYSPLPVVIAHRRRGHRPFQDQGYFSRLARRISPACR